MKLERLVTEWEETKAFMSVVVLLLHNFKNAVL